jgi:hypothetical protein
MASSKEVKKESSMILTRGSESSEAITTKVKILRKSWKGRMAVFLFIFL